ncbi:MAG: hypothetical protein PHO66_00745 [Eubacteriales bacterium]|nr:hypothetical protein [Eubacteriales bacterium]
MLTCLAHVSDSHFSLVTLNALNAADATLQRAAIDALLDACPDGSKFPYGAVDYAPYADSIAALIASGDAGASTLGQSLLKCIPETSDNFAFFTKVFEKHPTQALFQQLSSSYAKTSEGLPVTLDDGSSLRVSAVVIKINPSWKLIAAQDRPDTTRQLTDVLGYAGIGAVSSDAPTLEVGFSCTPLSKGYPGLLSKSYTGSDVTYTMKLTTADGKSKTISGQYTAQPPEKISVSAGTMAYLSDALDGPNLATIKAAYAQGLYKLFGLEALILMSQQDSGLLEPINKTIMGG